MDFLEIIGFKGLHISLAAEPLFHIGPITITNTIFMAWIVMALLVIASLLATRKMQLVPSGLQNFAEAIVEMLYDIVEGAVGHRARIVFPIIATFFIYIVVANWMGLLPGINSIGVWETRRRGSRVIHTDLPRGEQRSQHDRWDGAHCLHSHSLRRPNRPQAARIP